LVAPGRRLLDLSTKFRRSLHIATICSSGLQIFYFLFSLIPLYVVDSDGRPRLFICFKEMGLHTIDTKNSTSMKGELLAFLSPTASDY
jgi:hypothetical protein